MDLDTYEKGETIEIPVTFTDLVTGVEVASVPDATIEIFKGNTQVLVSTPMTNISGGRYFYLHTIGASADSGVYTVYITGTVSSQLQTASFSFSVSERLTNIQSTIDDIKLDIQANQVTIDDKFALVQADIGDPTLDGTTLHQELKDLKDDLGDPLSTGQDITEKLDDIRIAIGLGTPIGIVTVTGITLNDNASAIAGVRVVAINKATGAASDSAISNATGTYTLHLNPGTYVFEFIQATTVLQQTLEVTIPVLITTLTVPSVTLATKRTVTDIVKEPAPDNSPIPGVLVKAILKANFDANAAENKVEAAAFTNTSGAFTLDLFPGIYIFQFVKMGFDTLPQEITVF